MVDVDDLLEGHEEVALEFISSTVHSVGLVVGSVDHGEEFLDEAGELASLGVRGVFEEVVDGGPGADAVLGHVAVDGAVFGVEGEVDEEGDEVFVVLAELGDLGAGDLAAVT